MANPRAKKSNKNSQLVPYKGANPRTHQQAELPLQIHKQIEIDGIGMGVLTDGSAFLTSRGLARLCGVDSSRISEMSSSWDAGNSPMTQKVKQILLDRGLVIEKPYVEVQQNGTSSYAYLDVVCLAVLEYYAFDVASPKEEAKRNYRLLAGKALHDFIYAQVGYDPNNQVPAVWRQFHDRVSLTYNAIPDGYFGIFKEIADMIITLGEAGLHLDSTFVPDGSVGIHWGKHWTASGYDTTYGERKKWEHNYPEYFPQSASNPQDTWCYPESALGEFRKWMREIYIEGGKFTTYINTKIRQKELPASFAQLVTKAYKLDQ